MKKIIKKIFKVELVFIIVLVCLVSLVIKKGAEVSSSLKLASSSTNNSNIITVSSATQTKISNDIDRYYSETRNKHQMKITYTYEKLAEKENLILKYKNSLDVWEKSNNISNVYSSAKKKVGNGSGVANILTGYIKMKQTIDALFKPATKENGTLSVTEKINDKVVTTYYIYELSATSTKDYKTQFLKKSRAVKERVEKLILLYQVTNDKKYLAALKKEVVEAARWENYWQSNQYIDTAEIAYAVSLGYDYAYNALTPAQRCVIENRLLEAVLLYGTKYSSDSLNNSKGNYNQVGHSGAGIAALALIESSNIGEIKVLSVNDDSIRIEFPVKKMNGKDVEYTYKSVLVGNSSEAKITDEALYSLLKSKIKTNGNKSYIALRDLYSAVITKTINYLPIVMKSDNMSLDGSYPEGKDYYLFGMRYFSYYLASLNNTLKTDYNLLNFENNTTKSKGELNNIVLNPVYIASAKGENLNYGDAKKNTTMVEDDIFYLTNRNAENGYKKTANVVYDYKKRTNHIWGFNSIMMYNEKYDANNNKVDYDDVFNKFIYKNNTIKSNLNNLTVSAFRSSYTDNNSTFIAMKGGTTAANHTQLDLGTYVFDAMGLRWVDDAGSEYEGLKYHDKKYLRWQYYVARAEAHSTLVINTPQEVKNTNGKGRCLAADQWINAKVRYKSFDSSENSGMAVLDLTPAYNKVDNDETDYKKVKTNGNTVKRGIKLFNNNKMALVQDELHIENFTTLYSMINISNDSRTNIKVDIKSNTEVLLTDLNNPKNTVTMYLKSNNKYVRFAYLKDIVGEDGFVNDLINNPANNKLVSLNLNKDKVNKKKLVVFLHNSDEKKKNIDLTIGVYYIPSNSGIDVDYNDLKLVDLDSWSIPAKPDIKFYNNNKKMNNNDTIKGSAVIKLTTKWSKKKNEILKYSLDNGKTWYNYNENDKVDVQRRTISKAGSHKVSVLALLDDGTGLQSDTARVSNFTFKIEETKPTQGDTPTSSTTPANPTNPSTEKPTDTPNGSHTEEGNNTSTSEFEESLKENKEVVLLVVDDSGVLNKDDLKEINKSGKVIDLVKYDEQNKLVYSISIDGKQIKSNNELKMDSLVTTEEGRYDEENEIDKGVYININSDNIPKGSKFKINLSDKYTDDDEINVYTYDEKDVKLVGKSLKTNDGILEFDLTDSSKYYVTTASLRGSGTGLSNLTYYLIIILLVAVGGFFIKNYMFNNQNNFDFYGQ